LQGLEMRFESHLGTCYPLSQARFWSFWRVTLSTRWGGVLGPDSVGVFSCGWPFVWPVLPLSQVGRYSPFSLLHHRGWPERHDQVSRGGPGGRCSRLRLVFAFLFLIFFCGFPRVSEE